MCNLCLADVAVWIVATYQSGAFTYFTNHHPFNSRKEAENVAQMLRNVQPPNSEYSFTVLRATPDCRPDAR